MILFNRKRAFWVSISLLFLCLGIKSPVLALNIKSPFEKNDWNNVETKAYVPGEVVVKFKKDKIDLDADFSISSEFRKLIFNWTNGYETEDTLKNGNILVLKLKDGQSINEVLASLRANSNVEYAEPNYYSQLTSLSINDTYKASLWGLDNTGQTITQDSGVTSVGTSGADMDIRRAWELSIGTTEIIVAVIDSGVAYDHPDLADNMWDGSSCKDENGDALGGCIHGYDYYSGSGDNDPTPTDETHGTHVAGTVGAVQNNSQGISGVAPKVRIMALKTDLTSTATTKAIDFATQNGAKIINASWVYSSYPSDVYDAISRFRAAGGILIAAAGNDATNNEIVHSYPSDFTLDNIISVAALDQGDSLASFSNWGTTSVDIGAPGTSILSTVYYRKDLIQNFTNPTYLTPDSGSHWGIATLGNGVKVLVGDTNAFDISYENNSDYYITSDVVDLSTIVASPTEVTFIGVCNDVGTTLAGEAVGDYMALEVTGNGTTFTEIYRWNESFISALSGSDCSGGMCGVQMAVDIGSSYLTSAFQYRFHWVTDSSSNTDTGCYVYDMKILDYPTNGANAGYDYMQGTSMAAPHVAGLVAYLWSAKPLATASEIINSILDNGDTIPSLATKLVSGSRVNAYNSLISLGVTVPAGPTVTGLSDDAVPAKSKSFTWTSANPGTDQYRYSFDQSIGGVPSGSYGVGNTASYSSGSGTFYIHVQAIDENMAQGAVATASFILDNTGPSPTVSSSYTNTFGLSFGETLYTNTGTTLGTGIDLIDRFYTSAGIGLSFALTLDEESLTIGVSGTPLAGSSVNLLSGTATNNFYDYLTNAGSSLVVYFDGDAWEANPTSLSVATTYFPDLITTGLLVVGGSAPETATSITAANNLTITIGGTGSNSSVGLTLGTIITELNDAEFNANLISGTEVDISTISGLSVGYTAEGAIQWGIVGTTLKFSQPVMINLYLGSAFNAQTLYVYRSDSLSVGWTSTGLSTATCVVSGGYCSFATTQASYFLAALSPTPTPTPGPTSAPSNDSSNNNQSSFGAPEGPKCNDRIPLFAPDLFRITTTKGSAKVIYTPVNEKITGYAVMYGHKKGDERYAAMISPINNNEGEQSFTVNKLNPKITYYFKVTAFNGCVSGPWSDWIPAKADRKREIHKYKTVVKNKIRILVNKFK